jgi:hypothetical protein
LEHLEPTNVYTILSKLHLGVTIGSNKEHCYLLKQKTIGNWTIG